MKKNVILLIFFILLLSVQGYAEEEEDKENTFGIDFALLFFLPNLIDIDNYDDGIQTGGGVKMWFSKSIAIRVLVHLSRISNEDTETGSTELGFSGAFEYHFSPKELSPYVGGLVGVLWEMQTDVDTITTMYIGGFFGVEMRVYKSISLFGEYNLILAYHDWGYTLEFGTSSEGQIGILLYF